MSRRRLALLPVMLALVGGFWLLERGAPEVPLHLVLERSAPSLRALDLRLRKAGSDHVASEVSLRFDERSPAPRELFRRERLASGAWEVAVHERLADGREETTTVPVTVDGDRVVEVLLP